MKERELSRRERKKRETRQRLMAQALHLFTNQGYDETTVEEITDAADVAKGTFFNYFSTKEAILPAMVEWRLKELEEALSPEADVPASPVARIKLALHLAIDDPAVDPSLARAIFAALGKRREERPRLGQTFDRILARQVRQAQAVGEIRDDLDPLYVAGTIRVLFFQQMMWWNCGYRPAPLSDMLDRMIDLLLEGAAGENWRRPA